MGIIDQIAFEPEMPFEQRPMEAFLTVMRKRKLIISDVKTRVRSTMPNERSSRAARMQLSLYHRLLSNMIDGSVDMKSLFAELRLDSNVFFSDGFLAEAGTAYSEAGILTFDMLLENNNLDVLLPSSSLIEEIMGTGSDGGFKA